MKQITAALLLSVSIGVLSALDTESYRFIDHLLSISEPGAPEQFEDGIIFTLPIGYRRVGIAFAHEYFAKIHWFKQLLIPEDNPDLHATAKEAGKPEKARFLFFAYTLPKDLHRLEYRLIIDGLWTRDFSNPNYSIDSAGLTCSVVDLPSIPRKPSTYDTPPGTLTFSFDAAPGQSVTVGGSFNSWDPFMYELKEDRPGHYTLTLPLPPGVYQYVFFYHGQRVLDPYNSSRIYTKDGKAASEAIVTAAR